MRVVPCKVLQDSFLDSLSVELWNLDSGFQSLAGFQTADCWIPDSKAQDFTSYKQKFPYMGQVRARAPHLAIFYNKKNLEVLWIRVPPKIRSKAIVGSPSFKAIKLTKLSRARAPRMSIRFRTLASVLIAFWLIEPLGRRKHTSAWKCIFRWYVTILYRPFCHLLISSSRS